MSNVPDSIKNPSISSDAEKAVDQLLKDTVAPPQVVKKPNINTTEAKKTVNDIAGMELSDEQAADMINRMTGPQLMELAKRIDAVREENVASKTNGKPRYYTETEFANVNERDIYDFNVPIQAIDHNLPDYLDIKLKDPTLVARWINMDPRRMGQAIAEGWQYIQPEDLAEALKIQIQKGADGHYVYADVVAMKLTKEKVYGRIRGNFLKSLSLTKNSLALHEHMKNLIKAELSSGPDGESFKKYNESKAMGIYSPLGA